MIAPLLAGVDKLLDRIRGDAQPPPPRLAGADLGAALLCGLVAIGASRLGMSRLGDVLYTEGSLDIWFQADCPRVVANLLDAASSQYRAAVHPIFPILFTPWLSALAGQGASPLIWGKAAVAAAGALSAAAVFLALRFSGLPRAAALLFAALFVGSATYLHWYSVIEVGAFSGLSVALAVLALAYGPRRPAAWSLMSALTLGVTVTNWTAGLAATLARWPVRKVILISAAALTLTVALSLTQRLVYPTAGLFFDPHALAKEREYATPRAWAPLSNLRALVLYSAVTPAPAIERRDGRAIVSNQQAALSDAGAPGVAAILAWAGCLAAGAWGALREPRVRPIAFGLALMIGAQLALGLVYGDISFLYAPNLMPMLVLLAGLSWFTPGRWIAAALAGVVVVAGGWSNIAHQQAAAQAAHQILAEGGNPKWSLFPAGRFILPVPDSNAGRSPP